MTYLADIVQTSKVPSTAKSIAFLFAFLAYAGIGLGGQATSENKYAAGALRGMTRDPGGRLLPGAQVTVHNVGDASDITVVSGGDGAFLVTSLAPGQYQVSAKAEGFATVAAADVTVANHETAQMDLSLAKSAADAGMSPTIAKALEAMQKRIEHLEAELRNRNTQAVAAEGPSQGVDAERRTLLATLAKEPGSIPIEPGTLGRPADRVLLASTTTAPGAVSDPTAQAGKAAIAPPPPPVAPPNHVIPDAIQAPDPPPAVDNDTPFAFGDFTWLNGSPRIKDSVLDTKFFTPEVRFDTHYMDDFNQPRDHTIVGATESFRSGEVQIEQASVGGDFHWQNVRGRILFMQGLFATTTPRNDASFGTGQWDLRGAYKYVSEAYGGYHFNVNHGLNVDAGIFVSYIGLFSYYNFDNWTYQPSYVSSNTPWFFNGVRVQWFPTNKLKIEPWLINGWQSYARYNGHMGLGGQLLWMPKEWFKLVANQYGYGQDNLGLPKTQRIHTDDSIEVRYYNKPESLGLSKMAFSLTVDAGCQYGGGITCHGGPNRSSFVGWMLYNRMWFHKDLFALTLGGGDM